MDLTESVEPSERICGRIFSLLGSNAGEAESGTNGEAEKGTGGNAVDEGKLLKFKPKPNEFLLLFRFLTGEGAGIDSESAGEVTEKGE